MRLLQETEQTQHDTHQTPAKIAGVPPPSRPPMDSSRHKVIGVAPAAAAEGGRMCCVECRTTTTPMWRSGPTGPRSLCNACGIRYRKKRRQELGLDNKQPQQQLQQQQQQEATVAVKDSSSSSKSSSLQMVKKRRVSMGVEEAAFLLMALSSSSRPTLLHG